MPDLPKDLQGQKSPKIRIGRVDSIDLYEVKENELEILEKGSPANLQLNFAIFLLSLAFSCIVALCTATFTYDIVEIIFVFVVVVGIVMGAYLLLSWHRARKSISQIVKNIRDRIPKETEKPSAISSSVNEPHIG